MLLQSLLLIAQSLPQAGAHMPIADPPESREIRASSREMLAFSERALALGQFELADQILRTLLVDPELGIRNEARFRLAMLAASKKDWTEAGIFLRAILDEEPGAQRARLELARVQAERGELEASRRTLREAQAGGLPPEVARLVERFSAALRERKPFGLNLQFAFAPDSNINRATRSETLGTVIGDFELDDEARQSSGVGLSVNSEAYVRLPVGQASSLLARGGISGDFYRSGQFNDLLAVLSAGPEFPMFGGRTSLLVGGQRRWFGGDRYYDALDANLQWQRSSGSHAQLRAGFGYSHFDFRTNELQNAHSLTGFATYERALTSQTGASLTLGGTRQIAVEPAYSSASGQITATAWHDLGRATVFASATYRHFESDKRLAIYPERRREDFLRTSFGATIRKLGWRGWAPQVILAWEKNWSPIEIYAYQRWRGEFGFTRAF